VSARLDIYAAGMTTRFVLYQLRLVRTRRATTASA
jgi:hypothetical protein